MENRINTTNNVIPGLKFPALNNGPLAANNAPALNALNTADTSLWSRQAPTTNLADISAAVAELSARIEALEARLAEMNGVDPAAPASLPPTANGPAAAPGLPPGVNLPPLPATNASVAVASDDDAPVLPAQNNPASATLSQELNDVQGSLDSLQDGLSAAPGNIGSQRGIEGVAYVLKGAKLQNLTPAEEAVVSRAVKRVHEIGRAIANGQDPEQFQAELFALKHTLADPAGAGKHPAVTLGAQTLAGIADQKAALGDAINALQAKLAKKSDPHVQRQYAELNARYKALVSIQKALDGAVLTGLSAAGEKAAGESVNQLAKLADDVVAGRVAAPEAESQAFRLAQTLRRPGKVDVASTVDAGSDVVQKITTGQSQLLDRLRDIDAAIIGGAAPETYAAERARLLANAEALGSLGDAVKLARVGEGNAKARREVTYALAKAGAIADALGNGSADANQLRPEIFALRQTFQDPLGSKNNATVQAGVAALRTMGELENQIQLRREQIADAAGSGKDVRVYDRELAKLNREAEDLEWMRTQIEKADLGGLNPTQQARGAEILDRMGEVAARMAKGDDFKRYKEVYGQLGHELATLRYYREQATPAPKPPVQPQPKPPVQPAPEPAPPVSGPVAGSVYTVKSGDYLAKIAREQLGDAARYTEIVALNVDKYPSLATNPDLIYAGWKLKMPAGSSAPAPGGAQPVNPAPKPKPKPKPTPTPAPTPEPQSQQAAVAWLRHNADAQGHVSRELIGRLPAGPARDSLLNHFDALLFGSIEPGRDGWTHLHKGDLDRLERALRAGQSIDSFASQLAYDVLDERQIGDQNQDGRINEKDVKVYAEKLRRQTGTTPSPVVPTPAPQQPDNAKARLQADLDAYLSNRSNQDSNGALNVLNNAPQYAAAATPQQKARLLMYALEGSGNAAKRDAAVVLLKLASDQNELPATLRALSDKDLARVLHQLGDSTQGQEAARFLLRSHAYQDQRVWAAMDDDAVTGLLKSQGFHEPMIGTNDALRALPEAAKHHMIKQLLGGNLTWGELAQAEWLNQHTSIPYQIPNYRNR